ncbi:MAG: right-handed parallel beta-helix repeat-containing protein [Ignavibacteriae bacterium]|nr:right-handed parallel beta-helix repeat-containing protein [Ignavibacteriota bacterium]
MKKLFTLFVIAMGIFILSNSSFSQITISGSVGVDGVYTSLTNASGAFAALNGTAQTGATITITITGDVTTEAGTNSLNAGAWTSITIYPSGARTISGASTAGNPLIQLNGADNVTINGLNTGGNSLTISNTLASTTSGTSTIRFVADATNNTVTNCTVLGSFYGSNATNGGNIFISTGTTTGNDNITISYCNLGPAGATLPSKLIYGNGSTTSSAIANSSVTVSNNNLYDYFLTGGCAGMYVSSGNTDWTISNNRIFQTATRNFTAAGTMYGIYFSNTTYGNNIQITDNIIGYSNSSGTGTLTLTSSSVAGAFQGIYMNAQTTAANPCNINNNIVSNISLTSSTGTFYGIYNATGASSNTININNNQVRTITLVTTTGSFYGISWTSATNMTINGNTIRDVTRNSSGTMYCIYSGSSSVNETVINNNVYNISATSTTTTSTIYGIYQLTAAGTKVFQNNSVYSLSGTYGNTLYGISVSYGTTVDISNNLVHSLNSTGGTAGTVYGMYLGSTATTMNAYKNRIYNLSGANSSSTIYGVNIAGGTTRNLYNNFISDLRSTAASAAIPIAGIYVSSGTTVNLFYNTIYLNSTSSGTNFGVRGIYASTTPTLDMRNNIVVTTSTPNGTGLNVAYMRNSATLTTYSANSNNNLFYAGTPSAVNLIYYDGTNSNQTLGDFKTLVSPRDANSVTELPPFTNIATTPYDLHLSAGTPTQCESGGTPVSTPIAITDDYDGNTRNVTTPDIGADEGAFTPPAVMTYVSSTTTQISGYASIGGTNQQVIRIEVVTSGSGTPLNITQFDVNANGTTDINDINGTPAKIYYTGTSSTFSTSTLFGQETPTFTDFSVFGSQNLSEGTNYFWLAYDVSGSAAAGNLIDGECNIIVASGNPQVPSVTAPAGERTLVGPMAGNYYVGQGYSFPNFTTITDAFYHLGMRGISGAVTLTLTNAAGVPYNTANGETFPLTLNAVTGASGTNTITMKPNTGVQPIIQGSSANAIIKLNGTDYFTLDGSNSGSTDRSLTIENTNAAASTAGIWLASTGTGAGATYNTIKNCNIKTGINTLSTYGIFSGGTTIGTAGADNDNTQIINNSISKSYYGIYAGGTSGGEHSTVLINGNTVGSETSTDYVLFYGIYLLYVNNSTISQNEVFNMKQNGAKYGIYSSTGSSFNLYSRNKIHDFNDLDGNTSISYAIGMEFVTGLTDNTIVNNVIYKVFHRYTTTNNYQLAGIRIIGGTNFKLYYNSISMTGTSSRGTTGTYAHCLMNYSAATTNMDLRNNVFYNAVQPLSGSYTMNNYCVFTTATSTFTSINYNDYYTVGTNLGVYNGTTCANLAAWQTATTQDANSISSDPLFTSTSDLRPALNSPLLLVGTPIATVTEDYLGVTRSLTTPAIGAYEYGVDAAGPTISYTVLTNTTSTSNRTLSGFATITDFSGINTTSGTSPRIYYKKLTDANTFAGNTAFDNGWKWSEATNAVSPFDFTIDYSIIYGGSVALNDYIQYFIVAQDLFTTPNVSINSGTFAAAPTSVNLTSAAFPLTGTINQYKIVGGPLAGGTYTVGLSAFNKVTGKNLYYEKMTRNVSNEKSEKQNNGKKEKTSDTKKQNNITKDVKSDKTKTDLTDNNGSIKPRPLSEEMTVNSISEDASDNRSANTTEEYYVLMENGKPYTGDKKVIFDSDGINNATKKNELDAPNGVYSTITEAMSDLSDRGISGAVTFLLVDATYLAETYPFIINSVGGVSATNTITIKPSTGISPVISGSSSSAPIFKIYNTNYVTIDGSNNGTTTRDMTIENTSVTTPQVIWIGSAGTTPITNVTVKNCNIKNGINSSSAVVISDGAASGTAGYFNNITIQNNSIKQAYIGLYCITVVAAGNGSGMVITGNDLNSSGADAVRLVGIYLQGIDGSTITNNNIGNNANTVDASNITGIWLATSAWNSTISGNTITTISGTAGGPRGIYLSGGVANSNITISGNNINNLSTASTGTVMGIAVTSTTSGVNISKNIIYNLSNSNASGYNAWGIYLASTLTAAAVNVTNNVIYNVYGYGWASQTTDNGYGINIASGGGYNIYYNSISLATEQTLATGVPACLMISSTVTTAGSLDIRNNIFQTTQTIGTNRYAICCNAANTVFSNMNYNNYYTTGPNLGYIGATDRATLTNWRTGSAQDLFSISGNSGFTSSTNLQPDAANANCWTVNGGAYPIAAVTDDYLGNPRNTSVGQGPEDIGAYKVAPSVEPNAVGISGAITDGGTTTLTFAGTTIATLTWHAGAGTLPSSISAVFKPGNVPPGSPYNSYAYEYLDITETGGVLPYTYDMTVYYNLSRTYTINISPEDNLRVAKYSGSVWNMLDLNTTTNTTTKTVSITGIDNGFSSFTFTGNDSPLPVQLTSFISSVAGRDVKLTWKTESELNNAGFEIQRIKNSELNSGSWSNVGYVKSAGNSNTPVTYSFEDKKLNSGKYNYRLKQIDKSGAYKYFSLNNVIDIALPTDYRLSQNYPNPFNPTTKIDFELPFDSRVRLTIYDMLGREVKTLVSGEMKQAGFYTVELNGTNLSSGTYFYRLITNGQNKDLIFTKKMTLVK